MTGAAAALGLTRPKLYRWWSSSSDLVDDVNVFTATRRPGWRDAVKRDAPRLGLAVAVDRLATAPRDRGLTIRAVSASWPSSSSARSEIAWQEKTWLREFGQILASLWPEARDRPWTDIAIAVTALIEGSLLLAAQRGSGPPAWIGAACERQVEQLVDATVGADVPLPPGDSTWVAPPAASLHLVQELDRQIVRQEATNPIAGPTRLVDLELLARRLRLQPRRLYVVWPTVQDLNGGLTVEAMRAQRVQMERLLADTIGAIGGGQVASGSAHPRGVVVSVLTRVLHAAVIGAPAPFACAVALDDAVVAERVRPELERWIERQKVWWLALLQATGFHLRPGVDLDGYVEAGFGVLCGGMRLAALHPELAARGVAWRGGTMPTVAGAVHALVRSMIEPCPHLQPAIASGSVQVATETAARRP